VTFQERERILKQAVSNTELVVALEELHDIFYAEMDLDTGKYVLNPDKEWDWEQIQHVAGVFEGLGLVFEETEEEEEEEEEEEDDED